MARSVWVACALICCQQITAAYNGNAAVSWADKNCGSGTTECAEFVSNAIKQGGEACWNKWAPSLVSCLKSSGWSQTSLPGPPGSVVVYYDSTSAFHVALSRGDGTCDQHNNDHCGESCNWGSNYVLAPGGHPSPPTPPTPPPPSPPPPTPGTAANCASAWPGSASTCQVAVAVCLAESSGSCSAHLVNQDKWHSIDRGLWQINDHWHPEVSDSCAYDCACNGKQAYSISSSGTNWQPWHTYTSGAYRSHMAAAKQVLHPDLFLKISPTIL